MENLPCKIHFDKCAKYAADVYATFKSISCLLLENVKSIESLLCERHQVNPEAVMLFWSERYLHLNEEYMKYTAKAEIAESNSVVFKKLLHCKTHGDVYDITTFMSTVKYIRRYRPDFMSKERLNKNFVEIVDIAMRYFVQEFEQELLSLKRFATMYAATINTNLLLILGSENGEDIQLQEAFVDVQKLVVWDQLSSEIKSKYEAVDQDLFLTIKGQMLMNFTNPFKQEWNYAKEICKDAVSFKIFYHECMSVMVCSCGETLDKPHKHDLKNEMTFEVIKCGYNEVENAGCSVCEVVLQPNKKRAMYS